MKAVVFDGQLRFTDQADDPRHQASQRESSDSSLVIVDVLKAGICETDLQLCHGYMGFRGTLGHEFVGIAQTGRFAGRRVVGEINCSCGQCSTCQAGQSNHCPHRTVIGILNHNGAFAERLLVPDRNLHAVPDQLTDEQAVFVEPVAAACRIPQQIPIRQGQRILVLGDGRLGNLCAQVLTYHGADVRVCGRHDSKLQKLRDLGIAAVLGLPPSQKYGADVVVDCTGSPTGLETALQHVRPGGTVVLKTTVAAPHALSLAPVVIDEVTIVGSRCGPFDIALDLLARGAVHVDSLLAAEYPLEAVDAAFQHAMQKDALKVLFAVATSDGIA